MLKYFSNHRKAVTCIAIVLGISFSCLFIFSKPVAADNCSPTGGPNFCALPQDVVGSDYSNSPYTSPPYAQQYSGSSSTNTPFTINQFDTSSGGLSCTEPGNPGTTYMQADWDWVSESGASQIDGSQWQPIQASSSGPIDLQLNILSFVCYQATPSGAQGPQNTTPDSDTKLLSNGAYLAENTQWEVGNPSNTNNPGVTVSSTTPLDNNSSGQAGTVSCLIGQQLDTQFQPSTRYMFPTPQPNSCGSNGQFEFTPYAQDVSQTVDMSVTLWGLSTFYNGSSFGTNTCVGGDEAPSPAYSANPFDCQYPIEINLQIQIIGSSTCGPSGCPSTDNCTSSDLQPSASFSSGPQPNVSPISSSAPTGATTTPNQIEYTATPNNVYQITNVVDETGTPISWSSGGGYSSSPITLYYNNYVDAYPYDPHTNVISYNEQYDVSEYETAGSPSYYTCPNGGTLSGSSCSYGATCSLVTQTVGSTTTTSCSYSCPNGGSLSGSTCTYAATAWYNWGTVYANTPTPGVGTTEAGPTLQECLNREFSLSVSGPSVTLNGEEDYPTSATYKGTVNAQFGLTTDPYNGGHYKGIYYACQVEGITTSYNPSYTTPGGGTNPYPSAAYSEAGDTYGSSSSCTTTSSTPVSHTSSVSMPPLNYGDTMCVSIGVEPSGSEMIVQPGGSPNGVIVVNNNATAYSGTSCTSPIAAEPFMRVYGGDVEAGVSSEERSSCIDNAAGIFSYNIGNGQYGAGTTAAALASGNVDQFASGQNVLSMLRPESLTFADEPSGTYGFGGNYTNNYPSGDCGPPDYYSVALTIPGVNNPAYCPVDGIFGSVTVSPGQNILCTYNNQSVTFTGNITYNTAGATAGNLPNFAVVVKGGNININSPYQYGSGVSSLAGTYIAQAVNGPHNTVIGGTINDTGNATGEDQCTPGQQDISNFCAHDRLVITGSFIANKLDLYRTYGTLHDENGSRVTPPGVGDGNDAEEFDYYPINWLSPGNNQLTVQAISSLPPVY